MTENQRKWAIEEIENSILPDVCDEVAERALEYAIEALQKRPKGRWEEIRNAYGEIEGWICTCGREVKCKDNFCPNCGSDNRGEEE